LSALLTIATLIESSALRASLGDVLGDDRYVVKAFELAADFLQYIEQHTQEIDCLILQSADFTKPTTDYLYGQGIVLPTVFLGSDPTLDKDVTIYHSSEVVLEHSHIADVEKAVERSIGQFLTMMPVDIDHTDEALDSPVPDVEPDAHAFLLQQQRRLSEKLKERLGYLAVYYKRNPLSFFRNLTPEEREELGLQLREGYRQIVLSYFTPESKVNDLLDEFITLVFFADLSVSEVVEIHMDLMEEFSKQLKLEGWSEDILLDYRLTLIDVIAHLCEMYRRSVPREET
jgi:circadian clock protein KaiA